ncbi:hypothetical protein Bca4012_027200 [Brassica carinata]|uniref:Uncharacterized protein n=1 Tax=Brassica carinata TaxID=52824 RepID=A0A8X8AVC4_BRACI|nr:hypothetical protein Bca52824_024194 [Brassica carinata]
MAGDVGETNDRFFKLGEAAVDQEDKIVVPPRKEPEVEKKKKTEHEHESEFGEEKENKERKEKALKEIEMGNTAYKATVLCDLLGNEFSKEQDYHDAVKHHTEAIKNHSKDLRTERVPVMNGETLKKVVTLKDGQHLLWLQSWNMRKQAMEEATVLINLSRA